MTLATIVAAAGMGGMSEPRPVAGAEPVLISEPPPPPPPTTTGASAARAAAEGPALDPFALHSRPGSERTILLDFDGHTVKGTVWNGQMGAPREAFAAEPFSIDDDLAFSGAERAAIESIWRRVSEDFAPFDVDVTTVDPGVDAITRSGAGDDVYGTRVLITHTRTIQRRCGCGGVSYVDVFSLTDDHAWFQPSFVFDRALYGDAKYIAEAAAHEAGHTLSLGHDGTASSEYYAGHGAWAPIMGAPYDRPVSHWSRGEYDGADNREDDLAAIGNHLARVADDVGDTMTSPLELAGSPFAADGVIGTDDDVDVFRISVPQEGTVEVRVEPSVPSPDLDVRLRLLDAGGGVLATADPVVARLDYDRAGGLDAGLSVHVPGPGTYHLAIEGTGARDPRRNGYSGYASLGSYRLRGSFTADSPTPEPDPVSDLLRNGSFESDADDNGTPDGFSAHRRFARVTSGPVIDGVAAGRFRSTANDNASTKQTVAGIEAGHRYRLLCSVNIPRTADAFALVAKFVWRDEFGQRLGASRVASRSSDTGGNWVPFGGTGATAPSGAVEAQVQLRVSSLEGTVVLDDCSLGEA